MATVMGDLCAVVLAAGEGRRLRPLTELLPKALCPVGNVALLDRALDRVAALGLTGPADVAVNACYLAGRVVEHVGDRAHLSVEPGDPLGTSGGVGNLRDWVAGRGVLVVNADAYHADPHDRDNATHDRGARGDDASRATTHASAPGLRAGADTLRAGTDGGGLGVTARIGALLDGWDGESVRLLGQPVADPRQVGLFSGQRFAGFSLLPWRRVRDLAPTPSELVRTVWRPAEAAGELTVVTFDGVFIDTGTPRDYLAANLHAAGGANLVEGTVTGRAVRSVVGSGAVVAGEVVDSVVWPGATVAPGERLDHAIRAGQGLTVAGR